MGNVSIEEVSALLSVASYYKSQLDLPMEERDVSYNKLLNVYNSSVMENTIYVVDLTNSPDIKDQSELVDINCVVDDYFYPYTKINTAYGYCVIIDGKIIKEVTRAFPLDDQDNSSYVPDSV